MRPKPNMFTTELPISSWCGDAEHFHPFPSISIHFQAVEGAQWGNTVLTSHPIPESKQIRQGSVEDIAGRRTFHPVAMTIGIGVATRFASGSRDFCALSLFSVGLIQQLQYITKAVSYVPPGKHTKSYGTSPILMGHPSNYKWPCSKAMLNHQRVSSITL